MSLKHTHYLGKPCVNGHVNDDGYSIRLKSSSACVACNKESTQRNRPVTTRGDPPLKSTAKCTNYWSGTLTQLRAKLKREGELV